MKLQAIAGTALITACSLLLTACGPQSQTITPEAAPDYMEQTLPGELPPVTEIEAADPLPTPKSVSNPVTKSSTDTDLEQALDNIDSDLGTVMPGTGDLKDIE